MTSLVTGAGGFVGQHLVSHLRQRGDPVVGAGHGADVEVDFREPGSVRRLLATHRPEVIFHLAGTTSLAEMRRDPGAGHGNIVRPVVILLDELLQRHRATRLVLVSGWQAYGRPQRLPIAEDHPLAPIDIYGSARAATELVARNYLAHKLDIVIARPFHHTGPGQTRASLVPGWIAQHLNGSAPIRTGNLDLRRDICDVRDVVEGYALLASSGEAGQTYNLCSGKTVSLRALFELACPGATAISEPDVEAELPVLWGDASKLEALGWIRRYAHAQTVADLRRSLST